jgi:glutamate synthase domain-containing protein 3
MTGGAIYTHKKNLNNINSDYIIRFPVTPENLEMLKAIGETYLKETQSLTMKDFLENEFSYQEIIKLVPRK